jgi:hypothetical protein
MDRGIVHARTRTVFGALLGVATAFALSASVVLAGPPGNNGTVKIHDGATDTEPIVHNEPHVCTFHLHFFFADGAQSGPWWIQSWPPTGNGTTVMSGTYTTDSNGETRVPAVGDFSLDPGHYKLFWQGDESNLIKHKVFWVTCPPEPGGATPTPEQGGGPLSGGPTPFNGATDPASPSGNTATTLALLLAGGSTASFVLLRPLFRKPIRRD